MIILTAFPNWDREITTRFVTQTKIAESIAGKEHRAGLMPRPAVYQSFTPTNLTAALTQKFVDWRDQRGALPVAMPIWLDALYLPVPVEAGATSISIAARYRLFQWFKYAIILSNSDYYDIIQIRKPINYNDRILLEEEPRRRFDTGAFLCPLAFGKMMLPEQWYHNPKVTELVIDFEERLGIDANLIRYKNGHFAGAQYYPRSGNPDWPGGGGGFWDVETPPSPIEGDPGDGIEPVEPQKSTDIYPIKNAGDPIEEDPDGGDDPNPSEDEDPIDKATGIIITNTAEHLFVLPSEQDPVFNLYAGASACAVGLEKWNGLKYKVENQTAFYHYTPSGGATANGRSYEIKIVFALKLVLKEGVAEPPPAQARNITISCGDDVRNIEAYYNPGASGVIYESFDHPITLTLEDRKAIAIAIYGDETKEPPIPPGDADHAFSKSAKMSIIASQFSDGRYKFTPTIKNCPLSHTAENEYGRYHGWKKIESETNLWAGTATLGEIES